MMVFGWVYFTTDKQMENIQRRIAQAGIAKRREQEKTQHL
jgi:hypothetical protein